ncbi:MAG: hypothetical protein ACRYGM_06100 [Janthinobacterium lividum]
MRMRRRQGAVRPVLRPVLRAVLLASLVQAGGCAALGPLGAAGVGSIVLIQRDPADLVVSALTGLDCSVVRAYSGKGYCKAVEPPPEPPAYCTRSLGTADCWEQPDPYGTYQRGIADGPSQLTGQQEWRRAAPWPVNKIF